MNRGINNVFHVSSIVGADVIIGENNYVGPNVVIYDGVKIGDGNWIGPGAVIGSPPEHRSFPINALNLNPGSVTIGHGNVIREHVAIQAPTTGVTHVGNNSYLMHGVHIAHDNLIGSNVTIAPGTVLAGHVTIGDYSTIGIGVAVLQRVSIGGFSMVGMNSTVTKNIPPASLVVGTPARKTKLNLLGLERAGLSLDSDVLELLNSEECVKLSNFPSTPDLLKRVCLNYLVVTSHPS